MLARHNFAENGPSKRVKKFCAKLAKANVAKANVLKILIGFVLVLVLVLELKATPGTIHRACWSSSFSLSSKTG